MTRKELIAKVKVLNLDKEQRNRVVCSIIGHSKIITFFWGYVYCARCNDQIGDTLGSVFDTSEKVIVGHNCDTCRENYKALSWEDKLYVKNPFAKSQQT